MSDTLMDSEVLGVWQRIRSLIDLTKINATDKMNQKEQLRRAMENPIKTNSQFANNMDTLVENGFPSTFVENPEIRKDLFKSNISEIKVNGKTRYQVKAGTRPIKVKTGKTIRGGLFLKGKTQDEAIEDLRKKTEDDNQ